MQRLIILVALCGLSLSISHASRGAQFWECFGEQQDMGIRCMRACSDCKRNTGSKVNCDSVCRMRAIPAGTYMGRRII